MTSLAAFKRKVQEGTVIRAVNTFRPQANGLRTITKAQANNYRFEIGAGGAPYWGGWPSAANVISVDADRLVYATDTEGNTITLEIVA